MLKYYIKYKIQTKEFEDNFQNIINKLKDKKVLLCGNVEGFKYINKMYHFDKLFNIVAFAHIDSKKHSIRKIKTINYKQIQKEQFDYILITEENNPEMVKNLLIEELCSENTYFEFLFPENIRDTAVNMDFLLKYKFDKRLKNLSEKLKGKKVMFYGSGLFFNLINKYYDLSPLNALGVGDRFRNQLNNKEKVCGYQLYSPEEIKELQPDYVIISTRKIINIANELYCNYFKDTKTQIIPLVKKNIIRTIIEG